MKRSEQINILLSEANKLTLNEAERKRSDFSNNLWSAANKLNINEAKRRSNLTNGAKRSDPTNPL